MKATRERDAPLSGPLVVAKANDFAAALGLEGFKANTGWLHRFKKRENIVHKRLHGEAQSADIPARDKWLAEIWPDLKKNQQIPPASLVFPMKPPTIKSLPVQSVPL